MKVRSKLLPGSTALMVLPAHAVVLFQDNFDVSGGMDINSGIGAPRQTGTLGPLAYVATVDPNAGTQAADYHQQLPNGAVLQLAGDAGLTPALVSPDYDFLGATQVTVSIDTGVVSNLSPGIFTNAALTIGAPALTSQSSTGGFTVNLVQDTFGGNGEFLQVYLPGNGVPVENLIPIGPGFNTIDLFITGLGDGDALDGSGDALVGVTINGSTLDQLSGNPGTQSSFLVAGGFTQNHLTLEGSWAAGTSGLDTHLFDNLVVQGVPEPSAGLLAAIGGLALLRRRR